MDKTLIIGGCSFDGEAAHSPPEDIAIAAEKLITCQKLIARVKTLISFIIRSGIDHCDQCGKKMATGFFASDHPVSQRLDQ